MSDNPIPRGTMMAQTERDDSYEAMVFSAHLPNRCIAFIYKDGEPKLAGGIYRITRVRTATEADEKAFYTPVADDHCPLCNQVEPS